MFKKLGIKANELEGLLAQAACQAPMTLNQTAFDQLIMTAILARGEEKPTLPFAGQVLLNASTKIDKNNCPLSPFVYLMADPPATPDHPNWPQSLSPSHPWRQMADFRQPLITLLANFGPPVFTVVATGIDVQTAQTPGGSQILLPANPDQGPWMRGHLWPWALDTSGKGCQKFSL
ncbi:hypothetical protein O181_022907 [Austropuccinia psidii MF-1]|uniref:Uncharacterized protein n=1 Tax=Austropuccinia psidii MF-1 TaxID=1389203 RepID=A0A9Q3GXK6_9BASI|nr:hypothetical protein [Austropuccinia psidii MF-1]